MYCKYCGKEIADDSKFCSNCGNALEGKTTKALLLKFYKLYGKAHLPKTLSYIYGLWVSLNFSLLLISDNDSSSYQHFYPIRGIGEVDDYDIREFIFYSLLLPFALWLGINLYKSYKSRNRK